MEDCAVGWRRGIRGVGDADAGLRWAAQASSAATERLTLSATPHAQHTCTRCAAQDARPTPPAPHYWLPESTAVPQLHPAPASRCSPSRSTRPQRSTLSITNAAAPFLPLLMHPQAATHLLPWTRRCPPRRTVPFARLLCTRLAAPPPALRPQPVRMLACRLAHHARPASHPHVLCVAAGHRCVGTALAACMRWPD